MNEGIQKKLPLERSEYHTCIGIALSLGKSLEESRRDWTILNNSMGIDHKLICRECYEYSPKD